ncbi:hypothetical protein ACQJBY_015509 [Aegilops geniculata]
MQAQIPVTLCKLEKEFPPSFFDVMMHLPVHLANEALLGGPTIYRWMYLFERQIKCLKLLVRNLARPEASIAEGYIAEEFITLCSRYLDDVETKHNRPGRINDAPGDDNYYLSIFNPDGRPSGGRKPRDLNLLEAEQAHIYVLRNCDEVQPYISEYSSSQDGCSLQPFSTMWNQKFNQWFKEKVASLHEHDKSELTEDLLALSRGPLENVTCFTGYDMNGFRYRVQSRDRHLCTQNSGVAVLSEQGDNGNTVEYYGILTEIVELQYLGGRRVTLFRCNWIDIFDKEHGMKKDNKHGIVSLNLQRLLLTDEPFVLASQVSQVFFVKDNLIKGWHAVVKNPSRHAYSVPHGQSDDDSEAEPDNGDEDDLLQNSTSTSRRKRTT